MFLILALVIVPLIGLFALAIDIGQVYTKRREMQGLADALALLGASEALRNADEPSDTTVISAVNTALTAEALRQGLPGSDLTVTTNRVSRDGASSLDVTVETRGTHVPVLLRLFGIGSLPVGATATAGSVGQPVSECLLAMSPREEKSFEAKKKSQLSAPSCGIYVASVGRNSKNEEKSSAKLDGSASVSARSFLTPGKIDGADRITVTGPDGQAVTPVPVRADPVGGLKRPTGATLSCPAKGDFKPGGTKIGSFDDAGYLKIEKGKTGTIPPGTYCGIELGEEVDVTLPQGVYVLRDNGIVVKKKSSLVGDKITFFLTLTSGSTTRSFSPLRLGDANAKDDEWTEDFRVSLTAPTAGDVTDYPGILMFLDTAVEGQRKKSPGDWGGKLQLRTSGGKITDCGTKAVSGCQTLKLEGLVHIPGMALAVGKKAQFVGESTLFITRSVLLEEESSLTLKASNTVWNGVTPLRRVTLIR
ncbi:MAG: hypothetical protein RIS35_2840 [Pseudomonadota bacterium]